MGTGQGRTGVRQRNRSSRQESTCQGSCLGAIPPRSRDQELAWSQKVSFPPHDCFVELLGLEEWSNSSER